MIAQRHAEVEAVVDAVAVHLADVVVHAGGTEHGAGDAGVHGQLRPEDAHALSARHQDFVGA